MAISVSSAKVDTSERDSLLNTQVNTSMLDDTPSYMHGVTTNENTGEKLAGITASFAANVTNKIDTYSQGVRDFIDGIENANSEVAFKGVELKKALDTFVSSIREVANSYLDKLKAAEEQIINSVHEVYQSQDESVSTDVNSDSSTLQSSKVSVSQDSAS